MTAPRTFTDYANSLPNPKADRWDALVASGVSPDEATRRVEMESRGQTPKDYKPGAANAFLHGLMFGTSDEALGAVGAIRDKVSGNRRPFSDLYAGRVGEERARISQARQDAPVSSTVADFAGSVVSGGTVAKLGLAALSRVGLARAAAPVTLAGRAALGAAGGGGAGAASGYADAEGGFAERWGSAARGFAFGAAAGGALPLVSAGIRQLRDAFGLRRAGETVLDNAPTSAPAPGTTEMTPRSLFADTPRTAPRPMSAPVDPTPTVRSRIAAIVQQVRRDTPSSPRPAAPSRTTAAGRADEKVLDALTAGGQTLDDVSTRATAAAGRGKPVALVDVGGDRFRRLSRGARAVSGDVIDQRLGARAAAESDRFVSDIDDVLGTQRGIPQELDDMIARQRTQANELYPRARAAGIEVKQENAQQVETLRRVLVKPQFRDAFATAQRIAELADDPIGDIFTEGADGVTLSVIPDVRTLDYIKKGVDAVIERGNNGQGLAKHEASLLRDRMRDVLGVYDELAPEYGAARQAFAGEAELQNAYRAAVDGSDQVLRAGRNMPNFLAASKDEVVAALSQMTSSEMDAYRKGAVAALKRAEQNAGDGSSRVRKFFGSPAMRAKLQAIFPDQASFDDFSARMGDERDMRGSFDFLRGNSQTADKLVDAADAGDVGQIARGAMSGGIPGMIGAGAKAVQRRLVQGQSANIASSIADRATLGVRDQAGNVQEILDYLQRLRALEAARRASNGQRAATGGAAAGAQAGQGRP
jgi:hypothetical protein